MERTLAAIIQFLRAREAFDGQEHAKYHIVREVKMIFLPRTSNITSRFMGSQVGLEAMIIVYFQTLL